jgi:hypothetical protein
MDMAFWNASRHGSRVSLDDMARSTDRALNWTVATMLAAFILGGWLLSAQITLTVGQISIQAARVATR